MLQALAATDTPSLVRVQSNTPESICRALDRGADGVIVPLVNSADEATAAVIACHHPPRGIRSYGPVRAPWHPPRAEPVCVVMVETPDAVAALPDMLKVEGVGGVLIGPSDLALSHGMPVEAQHGDETYDALVRSIVEPCRAAGTPVGIFTATPDHAQRFRAIGVTFVAGPSDAIILHRPRRSTSPGAVRLLRSGPEPVEERRLQPRPRGDVARRVGGLGQEPLPGPPLARLHLVGPRARGADDRADEHRAQLVLLDAVGRGAVGEIGQEQVEVGHVDRELVAQPAAHGVRQWLVRGGVPAAGVGPHPREGRLVPRPSRDEQPARPVEPVAGEREVPRGARTVHGGLLRGADRVAVVVHQDYQLHVSTVLT
jgi:4-hydroxy-2-oxoheptanedioate aldolase